MNIKKRKSEKRQRTAMISFRATEEELYQLQELANFKNSSISGLIRHLVSEELTKPKIHITYFHSYCGYGITNRSI